MPLLIREAGRTFPATLPALDAWVPPWTSPPARRPAAPGPPDRAPEARADLLAGLSAAAG